MEPTERDRADADADADAGGSRPPAKRSRSDQLTVTTTLDAITKRYIDEAFLLLPPPANWPRSHRPTVLSAALASPRVCHSDTAAPIHES
jgi:hypothetical protein